MPPIYLDNPSNQGDTVLAGLKIRGNRYNKRAAKKLNISLMPDFLTELLLTEFFP